MAISRYTAILLLALSFGRAAAAASDAYPGIIGDDDRRIIDSQEPPWGAIGQVNVAGTRRLSSCTGTLVAPKVVVTAAHCLIDPLTGKAKPLRYIHFLAGFHRGRFLGHGRARCLHFRGGGGQSARLYRANPAFDVAVIVLTEPLSVPPALLAPQLPIATGTRLDHASYPRDRRYILSAHQGCRLAAKKGAVWLTDCDTNFGSSGGPVFTRQGGNIMLAAVMVGVLKHKASIAVPASLWRDLLKLRCVPGG